ncbi:ABC transporter ATP-binding protein [Dolosicoccus paucivorans]|uniref:Putative hemin import ATP-binding protein HrtA n=1 Tax=Dolosicoccus paucivorans TaxID=84521 RepID=A0A1G8MDB6_9LACT|nr:ABC transporter ATP-binding protein [Dolosicoccus paucivorans]PMB84554.1 ABC transporter ATP-binding protein [Dolosicoccus paucivorans]PMC59151.1 ABC transporter ATP-binding protein [Dolosicoccus paucivorans]SDI65928.1 putative ABC transport system ATP-binding protein [Dolosicoccus paucivorans]
MEAIQFQHVTKQFKQGSDTFDALKETNLTIDKGEFVAIIGPSGSGKSTFLTLAGGLQQPTQGRILINQKDITTLSQNQLNTLRFNEIGFVLQASNLVPYLTVDDQFKFIDQFRKEKNSTFKKELLDQLDIASLSRKYPEELSGGQRQRVAIAKALYNDPSVILADEPTASLDTDHAYEVVNILSKQAKYLNKAIIMVTHDERLIDTCDRVFKMVDGQLAEQ